MFINFPNNKSFEEDNIQANILIAYEMTCDQFGIKEHELNDTNDVASFVDDVVSNRPIIYDLIK
jgi:hypothetical protein